MKMLVLLVIMVSAVLSSQALADDVWLLEVCPGEVCSAGDWTEYPGKYRAEASCREAARTKGFGSMQIRCVRSGARATRDAPPSQGDAWEILVCPGEVCSADDWSAYPGRYATEDSCRSAVRTKRFGSMRVTCVPAGS